MPVYTLPGFTENPLQLAPATVHATVSMSTLCICGHAWPNLEGLPPPLLAYFEPLRKQMLCSPPRCTLNPGVAAGLAGMPVPTEMLVLLLHSQAGVPSMHTDMRGAWHGCRALVEPLFLGAFSFGPHEGAICSVSLPEQSCTCQSASWIRFRARRAQGLLVWVGRRSGRG